MHLSYYIVSNEFPVTNIFNSRLFKDIIASDEKLLQWQSDKIIYIASMTESVAKAVTNVLGFVKENIIKEAPQEEILNLIKQYYNITEFTILAELDDQSNYLIKYEIISVRKYLFWHSIKYKLTQYIFYKN